MKLPVSLQIKGAALALTILTSITYAMYDPNELIIKFSDQLSEHDRADIISSFGCCVKDRSEYGGFYEITLPAGGTVEKMLGKFKTISEIEYAEPQYIYTLHFTPNDTYYSYQWHYTSASPGDINIEAAWDIQTGDPNVIIAVIDSGVAYEDYDGFLQAPDLAGTNFVPGYDFYNNDAHPNDDNGHGTHVTGTIAQSTNNSLGVAGVAFNCSIMPVKAVSASGSGSVFDIADAIYYAVNNNAHVINMSLGGPGFSTTLRNAVEYAYNQGVTVVCSAGNEYMEGNPTMYPAAYDEFCIAVGATRYDRLRAPYSSTGTYVDIAAPGGDMAVDQNLDGYPDGVLQQTFFFDPTSFAYYFFQGTSMAAPHVAGVAGLLIANGVTEPDKVRLALESTALDLGAMGKDVQYGWGLLDAYAALTYTVPGDLTGDLCVTAPDLVAFAGMWLDQGPSPADFNEDEIVNYEDYYLLAQKWNH